MAIFAAGYSQVSYKCPSKFYRAGKLQKPNPNSQRINLNPQPQRINPKPESQRMNPNPKFQRINPNLKSQMIKKRTLNPKE